jgi:hypothetical protein
MNQGETGGKVVTVLYDFRRCGAFNEYLCYRSTHILIDMMHAAHMVVVLALSELLLREIEVLRYMERCSSVRTTDAVLRQALRRNHQTQTSEKKPV